MLMVLNQTNKTPGNLIAKIGANSLKMSVYLFECNDFNEMKHGDITLYAF